MLDGAGGGRCSVAGNLLDHAPYFAVGAFWAETVHGKSIGLFLDLAAPGGVIEQRDDGLGHGFARAQNTVVDAVLGRGQPCDAALGGDEALRVGERFDGLDF